MKYIRLFFTITALLSVMVAFNSCGLMSGKKFKEAIEQADKHFNEKKYDSAKTLYAQAQEFKPEDTYPAQRIKEIDEILKAQKIAAQYKAEIKNADELFKKEEYSQAKSSYEKASKLNSKENYPKEQISKINAILAEIKAQEEFLANPYHIVVGCFAVESNATRMHSKLMEEGYKSRIIPLYGGKYNAVTVNSFSGNTGAYNDLQSIKEKFPEGAWVLKH